MRDYGMYERTEAPQYYPPVERAQRSYPGRRHCEERSDEAIHLPFHGVMDCFAEPVIGRAFARPVGPQ